jgi:hypothetical protein
MNSVPAVNTKPWKLTFLQVFYKFFPDVQRQSVVKFISRLAAELPDPIINHCWNSLPPENQFFF